MVLSNNQKHENSLTNQKDGLYGKYGGLIAYGLILAFVISMIGNNIIRYSQMGYLFDMLFSFLIILPIGFSIALSVRTKGLDLSIPAMVMIASSIFRSMDTPLLGFIIALVVCIAIGAINAVVIQFLKLPGVIVTFITFIICSIIISSIPWNVIQWQEWKYIFKASNLMSILLVVIAAVIAVYIAVLSSKNAKKSYWTCLFPVYAGSGVLSVLYVLAYLFAGEGVSVFQPDSIIFILFAGVFFSITRFSKNRLLAIILSLLPCFIFIFIESFFSFFIGNYISSRIMILLMFILVSYRGRADIVGQSYERSYRARGWIALIPVILLLIKDIVSLYCSYTTAGASKLVYMLNNITVDIMLVIIAVGMGVLYLIRNIRNRTIEE